MMMMMLHTTVKNFISSTSCCLPSRPTSRPNTEMIQPVSPFRAQLTYLLFISFIGYMALISTSLRPGLAGTRLGSLDAAFMSISAVTSSSMSTVEMEVFTNAQLILFTVLMFLGGEVFISMLGLFLQANLEASAAGVDSSAQMSPDSQNPSSLAELGFLPNTTSSADTHKNPNPDHTNDNRSSFSKLTALAYLVLAYLTLIHVCGSLVVYLYMTTVPTAANVLKSKSIRPSTFSIFLTSSSFANCGFVPTNENMAIFKTNSALLLLIIPQLLMGNTFYPICIRILIRVVESATKNSLYAHILSNTAAYNYSHLLSSVAARCLGWTGLGFLVAQVGMLVAMDWDSEAFTGMSWFQRLVACLFQSVNSRHSGESVFDLSTLSTAVLVLFILMMYFPPYMTFIPCESDVIRKDPAEEALRRSIESDRENKKKNLKMENFIFSQLSYLTIFVILISITERKSLKTDPLNFSVLNIVLEVISAYGNVGLSMGYSCKRRVEAESFCEDKTYGFAGRWSSTGKLILIVVMIFGKLKRFNHKGAKAWKTL